MDIIDFIKPELLILVVLTYVLGMFLKGIPKIKDWTIPLILLVFTVVISILYLGITIEKSFNAAIVLNGFIYGVLSAGVAVYGNQVFKQVNIKRKEDIN